MEHYSRDRIVLRILNAVFFVVLLITNIKLSFFSGDMSFFNFSDIKFFMSPYKALYIFNFISLIYMFIFVIVQIDSSSYGIKKQVVENYSFFLIASFIAMSLHLYFLFQKRYAISCIFILVAVVLSLILYFKAQAMKKYMYNDEILVFVHPFSVFLSWNLIMLLMTFNLIFKNSITLGGGFSIVLALIELIFTLVISIAVLFLFNDKIFITLQVFYLITVTISTKLNDYFMPIGYLCFLSTVCIFFFLYKLKSKKNKN